MKELELFDRTLTGLEGNLCVIHVCAPAGLGKTTLLREFQSRCVHDQPVWLEGSSIVPTTVGVMEAFTAQAKGLDRRIILFVDEYDCLVSLDTWFRDTFLPGLPEDTLVILAGRAPLGNRWTSDTAWQHLSRSINLRNLSNAEQQAFFDLANVPEAQQEKVSEFTRGHPLAMSLVAANLAQNPNLPFTPESFPEVIRSLLERFAANVPTPLHRMALETAALIRVISEGILAEVVDRDLAFDLFEWLRSLSFAETTAEGLKLNDLARQAIEVDLRWRNRDLHALLHDRARKYYSDRLGRTRGLAQQAIVADYIYLHRNNPSVKSFFDWDFGTSVYLDKYLESDREALLTMTHFHEGPKSAEILGQWLDVKPESVVIIRSSGDPTQVDGFLMTLELQSLKLGQYENDPVVRAAITHLEKKAPLRKGEVGLLFRFWMGRESHQRVSSIQSLIFVAIVQASLTHPNLAHTFIPCADPEFWTPMFTYAALTRLGEADFTVGDRRGGMFGHDWRVLTRKMWLNLLSENELALTVQSTEAPRLPDVVLLDRDGFDRAVHLALKDLGEPAKLLANPLLRSKVVTRQLAENALPKERVDALKKAIQIVIGTWNITSRDTKLLDALKEGYLKPAANQEKAAERLDVSIATFRRHLQSAVERLSEGLWDLEIGS